MPHNSIQTTDFFWTLAEWIVKAAGSALLVILTLGWREWRRKVKMIEEIHILCSEFKESFNQQREMEKKVAVLENEIKNIKEGH